LQQPVLGVGEAEDPGVALHGGVLALKGDALLGEHVEPLRLDLGHDIGMRPGDPRQRPVGGGSGPEAGALEGGRDLDYDALPDAQLHLRGVGDHLDDVAIGALVARLGHQGLEPGTYLPGRQIATGRNELHPQGHRALPAIT